MLTFRALDRQDYALVETIGRTTSTMNNNIVALNNNLLELLKQQIQATQETNRQLDRLSSGFGFDQNGKKNLDLNG